MAGGGAAGGAGLNAGYAYVWEFQVAPGHVPQFQQAYGPDGEWVRLFRLASGYLGTDLLHDVADPQRFLTVDRWLSEAAYHAFRQEHAREYEALDARCEGLTVRETEIGHFAIAM